MSEMVEIRIRRLNARKAELQLANAIADAKIDQMLCRLNIGKRKRAQFIKRIGYGAALSPSREDEK